MTSLKDPDVALVKQLQQENAKLKLRVQRLELYIDLFNAPQKSSAAQIIHGKIQALEATNLWLAIQQGTSLPAS